MCGGWCDFGGFWLVSCWVVWVSYWLGGWLFHQLLRYIFGILVDFWVFSGFMWVARFQTVNYAFRFNWFLEVISQILLLCLIALIDWTYLDYDVHCEICDLLDLFLFNWVILFIFLVVFFRPCGCGTGESGCAECGCCKTCAGERGGGRGVGNDQVYNGRLMDALQRVQEPMPFDLFIGK